MQASTPPPAQVVSFEAARHAASILVRVPKLGSRQGLVVAIGNPRDLRRGPVKYEGGFKQQKLAVAAFPYNSRRDFFAAGLALNAGGGYGCTARTGDDVCHTRLGAGFFRLGHKHWRKLKITIFKPARQAVKVRVSFRVVASG